MEPSLTPNKIAEFENFLKRRVIVLRRESQVLTEEGLLETPPEETGELSSVPTHPADLATDTQIEEDDMKIVKQEVSEIQNVEDALDRIQKGTYGKCENCGRPIEVARLEAIPEARYCIACQRKLENRQARAAKPDVDPDDSEGVIYIDTPNTGPDRKN